MIKQLIKTRRDLFSQMIRFSIIGISSTAVHFSCVILLVSYDVMLPLLANIVAFLIAFLVSFYGHMFWTFANTTRTLRQSLPRFLTIAIASFALNESFYWYLLHVRHMNYITALLVVLVFVSIITFTLSKFWAFQE